jgi:hypothetical protein
MDFTFFINWKSSRWNILKMFSGRLGENWAWEFNCYATHSWIMIDGRIKFKGDHRGLFLMVGVLGYALDINIYDMRHDVMITFGDEGV